MRRSYTLISVIIVLGFIAVFIFRSTGLINPLIDLATLILRPVQDKTFIFSSNIKSYLSKRKSYDDIDKENNNLKIERDILLKEKSTLQSEIRDLNITRQEEDFLQDKGYAGIVARVIGRTSDSLHEEIIINTGTDKGLENGYAIVAQNGFLIGKITESHKYISKVRLLVDRQSEVAAVVQNETNSPGLVTGQHGLSLKMQLIPQNEIITRDQIVITSGLESNIPRGLIIGQISSTALNPGDIFQNAVIISPIRFNQLQIVTIIIPDLNLDD